MPACRRAVVTTLAAALTSACGNDGSPVSAPAAPLAAVAPAFEQRVLATGLETPHALAWGPDGQIWLTERTLGRISRLDPVTGVRRQLLTVPDLARAGGADGLIGFALHPELGQSSGNDYVYVSLTVAADAHSPQQTGQTVLRRYTFDAAAGTLGAPVDLLTGLPHSVDHQGGRLVVGPDRKLYFTIGDQGANQLVNYCRRNRAQDLPTAAEVAARDWSALEGKILRIELDGSIPADNPVIDGVRSYVYAYGFRNPQGLAFAADGALDESEQGPKSDDELNRITAGGNYGWPNIAGFRDDKSYLYANWSEPNGVDCASLEFSDYEIPAALERVAESEFALASIEPLATFYTAEQGYDFRDPACAQDASGNTCWPTIAPASLAIYESAAIAGWGPSLLVPSLKEGKVFRIGLEPGDAGAPAAAHVETLFATINRYRDVLVSADGRSFYVATDTRGITKGPNGAMTHRLADPGAILVFTVERN